MRIRITVPSLRVARWRHIAEGEGALWHGTVPSQSGALKTKMHGLLSLGLVSAFEANRFICFPSCNLRNKSSSFS